MELSEQLALELNRLERQAGRVGALLAKAEPELAEMALQGWAPAPPKGRQRSAWDRYWRDWLDLSAWRLGLADLSGADSLRAACSTEPDGIPRSPWDNRPQVKNLGHQSPGDHC